MLAGSQGGSEGAHAQPLDKQKSSEKGEMSQFIDKGETILKTMTETLAELSKHSKKLSTVAENVQKLQTDVTLMKRKLPLDEVEGPSCSKRQLLEQRNEPASSDSEVDDGVEGLDINVDQLFEAQDQEDSNADNFLEELEQFFEEKTTTGEKVSDKMARVANASLRGSFDEEKFKELKDKYQRPENVDNLQIPQADPFIWRKLERATKARDVQLQKASAQISQCLVPVLKTLDLMQSSKEVDKGQLRELVTDTFKMMVSTITSNNKVRREMMFKEMLPQVKSQCMATVPSATKLFGEKIKDDIKSLTEKDIQVTPAKPFLFKRGGVQTQSSYQQRNTPPNRNTYNRNQSHNSQNYGHQRVQKPKQHWQQKKSFPKQEAGNKYRK